MENNTKKLMAFDQALELVLASAKPASTVKADLQDSLNCVLAEDVYADRDTPPFNKSAMDGYACRQEDLANELRVIDEIPAGSLPRKAIGPNQCARIMTGAMVPEGADFVLMKEFAEIKGPDTIRCTKSSSNTNICYQAEDLKKGELILRKGTLLKAPHLAVLASVGIDAPLIFKRPTVAVISTGSELIEPSEIPQQQQIRNSNSYQLVAQLKNTGILADYLGIVRDEEQEVYNKLESATKKYDIVLISGGVSVGDYDYVPEILNRLGAKILLHSLNVKPGKHLLFAKLADKYIFGLPGNPVSSFVQFELLVKPFILEMMGCTRRTVAFKLPLATDYFRKKADNLLFVPVSFTADGAVQPVEYHGSAHIHAYTMADGILEIPVGQNEIKKGELVHVRPL
jgi:molybdopterin molybdotransferase